MVGPAPDIGSYLVLKHSTWKGKYRRILSVSAEGIATYNPNSLEVTNQWVYKDIISIMPSMRNAVQNQGVNEFQLSMYKKNKVDSMRFSCEHRVDILTKALGHASSFSQPLNDELTTAAQKLSGQDGSRRVAVVLAVTPRGLEQRHAGTGDLIAAYHFGDIEALLPISELKGGLAIKSFSFGRLHIFSCDRRDEVFCRAEDNCRKYIGLPLTLAKQSVRLQHALEVRMGRFSEDIHQTSLCEFSVQKLVFSARHPHCTTLATYESTTNSTPVGANYISSMLTEGLTLVRRTLCLTETCLVERDPVSYCLVTLRPLSDVHCLVRCQHNPQRLEIEWVSGGTRTYICADRDALLASLMDGTRASGNFSVHVRMTTSDPSKRLGPTSAPVDEEVESMCLRILQQPPVGCTFAEVLERFNANVPYSGLLHSVSADGLFAENKERLITGCLGVIVMRGEDGATIPSVQPFPAASQTISTPLPSASSSTASSPASTPTSGGPVNSETLATAVAASAQAAGGNAVAHSSALQNSASAQCSLTGEELQAQFHALRRLVASKAGFAALTALPGFREKVGVKVVRALQRMDAGVTHAALDFLCALLQPMHDNPDLKQEQLNKTSLLHSQKFQQKLMETFVMHVQLGTGGLVIGAMLDFVTFAVCAPYSETTDGAHFDFLLGLLAENGRTLYQLFQHPSLAIVKGAGLVLKAIIEEGEGDIPNRMQQLALTEGALLSHLYTALYTRLTADGRLLGQRQLSRHLSSLWTSDNEPALELLSRMLPRGLLAALDSTDTVPPLVDDDGVDRLNPRDNLAIAAAAEQLANQSNTVVKAVSKAVKTTTKKVELLVERHMDKIESVERTLQPATKQIGRYYEQYLEKHVDLAVQHWKARFHKEKSTEEKFRERPLVLRKRRERTKCAHNWPLFYYKFSQDHSLPNLIWNHGTREELRVTLEKELREFTESRDHRNSGLAVCWNHAEFEVLYPSLNDEIKIGDYYLRILLEQDGQLQQEDSPIRKSYQFFNDLYHRFLLTPKVSMKCMCLQAMTLVYGLHHAEIGPFNDTKYMVTMLSRSQDRLERDRLLLFLNKLLLEKSNVREVLEGGGVRVFTELASLAHLHVQRAGLPTATNTIESAPDSATNSDAYKEWYYQDSSKKRAGPYSFRELKELYAAASITSKTLVWAQGMDGWKNLLLIPQLKWTLVATGQPVMTESELAAVCLTMMTTMCRYFPSRTTDNCVIRPLAKVKKYVSDVVCLPTIVQLLLTFDPGLVEKVATLLCEVLQDNPSLCTSYTSGLFFFILMYRGSNVLPIARLLHLCHLKQAFRPEELSGGDLMQQSILGPILPEAMVCYLFNYGPEKFAEIFLGEFDTPEVIWNREMRRYMIEKLASHLADFTPRLLSNTMARYQYCPIPHITYPQLDSELFCDIYYLKHLCDTAKFPDWPIKDPVPLLKKVLTAWRNEVEKQPSSMSVDQAYKELELPTGERHRDEAVRHAYLKLAQKYHPDKNPEGRMRFESVKKAYEYLCSRSAHSGVSGPDPRNIVLMIRTQSILFRRYQEVLAPYKYAGYPMLLCTVKTESGDNTLFSKETSLLPAAVELCYRTINCCALNAEQLCREHGLEILQDAYSRCVSVLSDSAKHTSELAVEVCVNTAKCFDAAAAFTQCRQKILEMPAFIINLCYTLYFKDQTELSLAGVQCVASLAADSMLQMTLLKHGVLFHLLPRLFQYDYTLDEGGVSKTQQTNAQELINNISIASLRACGRLAGLYRHASSAETSITNENSGVAELKAAACEATPHNPIISNALQALLTPYLVSQIAAKKPQEVLKLLTSNVCSPYMSWDNSTRAQLLDYLESNARSVVRTGECDPSFGAEFVFDVHKNELVVGGIFIRIYNEQPLHPISNPKQFCQDLLAYIGGACQYLHSLRSMPGLNSSSSVSLTTVQDSAVSGGPKLKDVAAALQALHNVCVANPGVELQCVGHFRLLLSLLGLESPAGALALPDDIVAVQRSVLKFLSVVSSSAECVNDIAASQVVVYLLVALHSPHLVEERPAALAILQALVSSTGVVKELLKKGGVLYVLNLFCSEDTLPSVREKAAELLGAVTCDRLVGQRIRLLLLNILRLPVCLVDQFRDGPSTALHLYQSTQENPDLVWTDESRNALKKEVAAQLTRLYELQRRDPNVDLNIPESTFSQPESALTNGASPVGELVIGGVYVRLLQANPSWTIRKPKLFMTELFDALLRFCADDNTAQGDDLELIVGTVVAVLGAQQGLMEYLPSLGHLPRVVELLRSQSSTTVRAAVLATHQCSFSKVCCAVLETVPVVTGLVSAMSTRRDLVAVCVETLHNLFRAHTPVLGSAASGLHQQAASCSLVQTLLELLESSKLPANNPAATKAQLVECIKTMADCPQFSQQIISVLHQSSVWREFRDQKHDLFLDEAPITAYHLTGGPGTAGYLTQGPSSRSAAPSAVSSNPLPPELP